MAMTIEDAARLQDHLDNRRGIGRHPQFNDEFLPMGTTVRTVRGSAPSAAKARQMGTNGKLGVGGILSTTASDYTRRISRSAESQAINGASKSVAVADFMASIGMKA